MTKKILIVTLITSILFSIPAFASELETADSRQTTEDAAITTVQEESNSYDESIKNALELIKDTWQKQADEYPDMMSVPFVDIKNTRILKIAEEPVNVQMDNSLVEELKDIDCIIEFMMLTNYFGDSLPMNAGVYDTVAVYRKGKMEVQKSNLLNAVRAKYYITDYSGVIEEIIDLGDAYSGQLFEG